VPPTIRIDEAIGEIPLMAGYPGRLHQVIVNLVVNASQAIGDGAGTISVALDVARRLDWSRSEQLGGTHDPPFGAR
jgi:signal transduction histidine kinase